MKVHIAHLDDGVRVSDGPAVRGVEVGHGVGADLDLPHLAELVLGLLGGDPVHGEPSLHVVDDAEVLPSLFHLDDVHEASWEPEHSLSLSAGRLRLTWGQCGPGRQS